MEAISQTEQDINKSVAEIAAVADKLPGVVIIHDLSDCSVACERGLPKKAVVVELSTQFEKAGMFRPWIL